jgi:predicted DNA-binding ArsR family transcriptional regulator
MWRRVDILLTDVSEEHIYSYLLTLVHRSWISYTLMMEAIRSPKRRLTKYLHGATSLKTTFFIVTAVKTSNPTQYISSYNKLSVEIYCDKSIFIYVAV